MAEQPKPAATPTGVCVRCGATVRLQEVALDGACANCRDDAHTLYRAPLTRPFPDTATEKDGH